VNKYLTDPALNNLIDLFRANIVSHNMQCVPPYHQDELGCYEDNKKNQWSLSLLQPTRLCALLPTLARGRTAAGR
jgi:hypothetical protein